MATLGSRLRSLRTEKHLTQEGVANKLGVARATLASWEIGRREPDNEALTKLAEVFGVSVDYLLGRTDGPHGTYLPPGAWPVGPMVRVPVLGVIRAGLPILADEHIDGWELTPADEVKDGKYFYLRVTGDSMIGSRIYEGDLVLVRQQEEVENGEIAVVNVDGENATLKRVYRTNGELILQPDNPKYAPIIIKSGEARFCGKVVEVTFKL
ncbi:MAG TPA: helix-turn-helix domain-containing protein [Firmicutes bacterium]|jgi:repressor LexA|nr:helix-turn-helix domain-containing protein [Bacillota bacterium]